ncbi:hypothetical protein [Vampirovibrio chlorellavorus]|uniref:hypothetical protein n=1 Tax=Vampirovibrio chlorellavorus TaxID=758823 RepID=UPI0026F1A185|nr:hypothetical protein [Vampirovibrio chlorellavorus]
MSMSPPDLYAPNTEGEAEAVQNDSWQLIEAELKRARNALQQPIMDTFICQSKPQRERTVLDLKSFGQF